jgi:cardiolipin synthase
MLVASAGQPEAQAGPRRRFARRRHRRGSRGAAASAMRLANTVGAAVTNHRTLGRAEGRILALSGVVLVILGVLAVLWPRAVASPLAVLALWVGLALVWRSGRLFSSPQDGGTPPPPPP